ncbi:MAG TPA: choice-of-anchor Q domain-containing protein, partial [Terrimesophilobacter sp.]|nr:choice-of-anchor Q domain-containing protein [Terrimesophilobacter sp.]
NIGEPGFIALSADQRGENRVSGGRLDIGAVEVQQGLAATGAADASTLVGGAFILLLAGGILITVRNMRTHKAPQKAQS